MRSYGRCLCRCLRRLSRLPQLSTTLSLYWWWRWRWWTRRRKRWYIALAVERVMVATPILSIQLGVLYKLSTSQKWKTREVSCFYLLSPLRGRPCCFLRRSLWILMYIIYDIYIIYENMYICMYIYVHIYVFVYTQIFYQLYTVVMVR